MHAGKQKHESAEEVQKLRLAISYLPVCCFSGFLFCWHCSRSGWEERKKERKGRRKEERWRSLFLKKGLWGA
jgi:hypothetical protein